MALRAILKAPDLREFNTIVASQRRLSRLSAFLQRLLAVVFDTIGPKAAEPRYQNKAICAGLAKVTGAGGMTMKFKAAIPLLVVMAIGLAACEEGQFLTAPTDGQTTVRAPAEARIEIQEVERADIFSASELALWDGRPSLGGLWVAHPDVGDPERVLIRNATNGQSIYGALFRRERNNPGPRIQLSSEAATELGILAGRPTELSIVVVRQQEVTIEPEALALDATPDAPSDETAIVAVPADAEPEQPPQRQGFFARLFGGGTAASATQDDTTPATADGAIAPSVETETLDPITTGAAAAISAAEASATTSTAVVRPQRRAVAAATTPEPTPAPVAAPAPAPEPVVAAVPTPAAPALNRPYVQVGLFTVEANASAAATGLRQGGIVPTIVPGTNATGTFWRVLVGPMTSPDDQSEILGQVKSLGYADAFLVSN